MFTGSWRKTRRQTQNDQALTDLLYNKLFQFFVLFVLAFVLINEPLKKGNIENKAEILITITWPEGDNDVDLWCQDPQLRISWYNNRDVGFIHLDRDDLGNKNDTLIVNGIEQVVLLNQEILSVRKLIPGEYTCNIHLFRVGEHPNSPIPVHAKVEKVNPSVQMVFEGTQELVNVNDEKTIVRFTVTETGVITNVNTLPKALINDVSIRE